MQCLLLCAEDPVAEAVVSLAKENGLGIEIQTFAYFPALDNPAKFLPRYRKMLSDFSGLRSFHGPFADLCPGSSDPMVRQVAAHRIRQFLPIAKELGITHVVMHHGYVPHTSAIGGWLTRSADFWKELLREFPATISIHLENYLDETPELVAKLIDALADPRIGACLDIGHCHAMSRMSPIEWIRTLQDRVRYVHLHDNDGSLDQHLPFGKGNIPLEAVLNELETYSPNAIWAVETDPRPSIEWLKAHGIAVTRSPEEGR